MSSTLGVLFMLVCVDILRVSASQFVIVMLFFFPLIKTCRWMHPLHFNHMNRSVSFTVISLGFVFIFFRYVPSSQKPCFFSTFTPIEKYKQKIKM